MSVFVVGKQYNATTYSTYYPEIFIVTRITGKCVWAKHIHSPMRPKRYKIKHMDNTEYFSCGRHAGATFVCAENVIND